MSAAAAAKARAYLTVAEVMTEYGFSRAAIYRMGQRIPRYRPPGLGLLLARKDIEDYIRAHTVMPPPAVTGLPKKGRRLTLVHRGGNDHGI